MDLFTWIPEQGMTVEDNMEQAVRRVQFGSGVVQLQKCVLGNPLREFSLTFKGYPRQLEEIKKQAMLLLRPQMV